MSESEPKECRGKTAARTLAMIVSNHQLRGLLAYHDPKALEQAYAALEPFGWPCPDTMAERLGVRYLPLPNGAER